MKIGIVGPCGAGKSTLIGRLKHYGYNARHIVQEHSYVPAMWQRISHPDMLIYLDVSYPVTIQRRCLDWTADEYKEQVYRLRHAREHADLYIHTDDLTPEQVLEKVQEFIELKWGPNAKRGDTT